jgi:TRAP-type mannitol/chloroaromatic compound transport system permease small subunit
MNFLKAYIRIIDNINTKLGKAVAWLTTVLMLVVCVDVFTRYLLKNSSIALQELEWHLFAVIFLGAAAYTLLIDDHVRVDVFYAKFSKKGKAWIDLFGSVFLLIPFCILVIFATKDFVALSFKIRETSPDPGGLPARYILKAFIPVSFVFLLLEGISLAFKSFITIKEENSAGGEKD